MKKNGQCWTLWYLPINQCNCKFLSTSFFGRWQSAKQIVQGHFIRDTAVQVCIFWHLKTVTWKIFGASLRYTVKTTGITREYHVKAIILSVSAISSQNSRRKILLKWRVGVKCSISEKIARLCNEIFIMKISNHWKSSKLRNPIGSHPINLNIRIWMLNSR